MDERIVNKFTPETDLSSDKDADRLEQTPWAEIPDEFPEGVSDISQAPEWTPEETA